eukprot:375650-Ditylum_brightwellii.AAC.1
MKETLDSFVIKARAYVIYQWLAVLLLTHQYYDELNYLNEIEYPEVQQIIGEANQDLINLAATSITEVINDVEESVVHDVSNVCSHQSSIQSHFLLHFLHLIQEEVKIQFLYSTKLQMHLVLIKTLTTKLQDQKSQ